MSAPSYNQATSTTVRMPHQSHQMTATAAADATTASPSDTSISLEVALTMDALSQTSSQSFVSAVPSDTFTAPSLTLPSPPSPPSPSQSQNHPQASTPPSFAERVITFRNDIYEWPRRLTIFFERLSENSRLVYFGQLAFFTVQVTSCLKRNSRERLVNAEHLV
jgi:hypothetical protein